MSGNDKFDTIVVLDFEYTALQGEPPVPICVVAKEHCSGAVHRVWFEEGQPTPPVPYVAANDCLVVAYSGTGDLGCIQAVGWPPPAHFLDLYVEFRNHTNGLIKMDGTGLIAAMAFFGLDTMSAGDKDQGRKLAMRGGPFTSEERAHLLIERCISNGKNRAFELSYGA